ncbi:MAG TPA: SIR2 family protein [Thermoanaerobaculia bacterium]|jgi:hypothetical protein
MIVERIHDRSCVPFLGAAVNASAPGYAGLPLGGHVALKLIERFTDRQIGAIDELMEVRMHKPLIDAGLAEDLGRLLVTNLPRVALHVLNGTDWPYLQQHVSDILGENTCEPSPLLRVIAQLPFNLVVTTNYDRLMERAIDSALPASWRLSPSDLTDQPAFIDAFKQSGSAAAIIAALHAGLPSAFRKRMDAGEEVITELCEQISEMLDKPQVTAELVARSGVPSDLRNVAAEELTPLRLRWLNRSLLEAALPKIIRPARKRLRTIVQPAGGFTSDVAAKLANDPIGADEVVVYKIHGSFREHLNDQEILITEDDYVQFLTIVGTPQGVPPSVSSKMSAGNLLFLGYNLEDWDFRTLYKGLIERRPASKQRKSFAIQKQPSGFWVKYWEKKDVVIYDYDIYDFAAELSQRYSSRYGSLTAYA